MANSEKISTIGETTLPLVTSVGIFPQNLIVAEINEPLILGNYFLSQNRCLVDVANSCLNLNSKTLWCTMESKVECLFWLRLPENVQIPTNSKMIIPGYVTKEEEVPWPEYLMVDSSERVLPKGLVLAKALIKPDNFIVPVRVMNPTDVLSSLYKETVLGRCCSVREISEKSRDLLKSNVVKSVSVVNFLNHMEAVLEDSLSEVDQLQKEVVKSFLLSYADLFAKSKLDRGKTHLVQHKIDTGDHFPIKQRPRCLLLRQREAEREEVGKML